MQVCVFEDAGVRNLQPLTLTRPAFDLRCGAVTLLERMERYLPQRVGHALVRPELVALCRDQHPQLQACVSIEESTVEHELVLLVNARWLAPAEPFVVPDRPAIGHIDDRVIYALVPSSELRGLSRTNLAWRLAEWKHTLPNLPVAGRILDYPWEVVESNGLALEDDYVHWWQQGVPEARNVSISGPTERCLVAHDAEIEPMVHIDTRKGPVLIDRGAFLQAFSRVEGPCYIGAGTRIVGASIHGGSFGPECRIGGEVERSIVHGYSNKAHEGFLGHSYVGEWVNLAAGTQTSDLRTDYRAIQMLIDGKSVDTGLLKIGSFIGDHTKTSLNALFNTGSLIGAFCQLLGNGELLPRVLPSFCRGAHGKLHERNDLRAMISTARTVMARRNIPWTDPCEEFVFTLFEETASERRQILGDSEMGRRRRVI